MTNHIAEDSESADPPPTAAGTAAAAGTEFMPEATRNVATPAAWSEAEDVVDFPPTGQEMLGLDQRFGWFTTISAAVLLLVVTGMVAVWTIYAHHRASHTAQPFPSPPSAITPPPPPMTVTVTSQPSSSPPPVPVAAPTLDGAYRFDLQNKWHDYMWMGFRSACTPTGCAATGTALNAQTLQPISAHPDWTLHWNDWRWEADDGKFWLIPQPDGTYQGAFNSVFCTATKTAPTPPGLEPPAGG